MSGPGRNPGLLVLGVRTSIANLHRRKPSDLTALADRSLKKGACRTTGVVLDGGREETTEETNTSPVNRHAAAVSRSFIAK